MKKKVGLLVLSLVIFFTFVFPVSAESLNSTRQTVLKIAKDWGKSAYDISVSIKDVIEICDYEENTMGYCISYKHGNQNMGYVVIDINRSIEDCIVEYCLEGDNIYYTLLDDAQKQSSGRALGHRLKIYCYQPFHYAINVKEDEETLYYTTTGEVLNENKFADKVMATTISYDKSSAISSGVAYSSNLSGSEVVSSYTLAGQIGSVVPIKTTDYATGAECCGPTALTNLMIVYYEMYNMKDLYRGDSIEWTFDRFVAWLEVMGYYTPEDGTDPQGYDDALYYYVREQNSSYVTDMVLLDGGAMSAYIEELWNGYPILTSIEKGEENHALVTIGYQTRATGNSLYRYLRVLDGWTNSVNRYLNYDYYDLLVGRGVRIS